MSISVELTSKDMINSYFERVCLGDVDKFKTDLQATNTPKLQKIKKALDIKASDKKEAIEFSTPPLSTFLTAFFSFL